MIIQKFSGSHGLVLITLWSIYMIKGGSRTTVSRSPYFLYVYVQGWDCSVLGFHAASCRGVYFFRRFNSEFPRPIQYISWSGIIVLDVRWCTHSFDHILDRMQRGGCSLVKSRQTGLIVVFSAVTFDPPLPLSPSSLICKIWNVKTEREKNGSDNLVSFVYGRRQSRNRKFAVGDRC
jgi:hypothetical protein